MGQRFWARGYFSTTSGNITNDIIMNYLDRHTKHTNEASALSNETYRRQPVCHSVANGIQIVPIGRYSRTAQSTCSGSRSCLRKREGHWRGSIMKSCG